jgi:NADH:ubiquinone oxidoreductase subunit D
MRIMVLELTRISDVFGIQSRPGFSLGLASVFMYYLVQFRS